MAGAAEPAAMLFRRTSARDTVGRLLAPSASFNSFDSGQSHVPCLEQVVAVPVTVTWDLP